jgi:5-methylcytosine-specific restriction enzyme A
MPRKKKRSKLAEEDVKVLLSEDETEENDVLNQLREMNVKTDSIYNLSLGDELTYKELTEVINNRSVKGIRYRAGDSNVSIITTLDGTHDNPYHDRFENGRLYYTGEGRQGPQSLTSGNLRLYECQIQKTPVHVFQKVRDNHYVFLGLFQVIDHYKERQPDDLGEIRDVFIFEMAPIIDEKAKEKVSVNAGESSKKSDEQLLKEIEEIQTDLEKQKITKKGLITRYKRSRKLVENLKELYDYECQLCDPNNPTLVIEMKNGKKYVEVHHIEGFAEVLNKNMDDQEKGDFVVDHINNVICVCVAHHKLLHHYKSPLYFDATKQAFVAEDGSLELPLYKKHKWHKIGEKNNKRAQNR